MPKPMRMMIEVEEFAFGTVFRRLDGMPGVVAITPIGEGVKEVGTNGSTKGQKRGGAQSAPCVILGALIAANGVPLPRTALSVAMRENGKAVSSLADTMKKLREAKHVTRSGAGKNARYRITPAGRKRFDTACTIQPATSKE